MITQRAVFDEITELTQMMETKYPELHQFLDKNLMPIPLPIMYHRMSLILVVIRIIHQVHE
jgi:hypothetical protein